MVLFRFFQNSYKIFIKKIMIILTCITLVIAPNLKNAKAFFLIDDLACGSVIALLCAGAGVALTASVVSSGAGEIFTNAVNSYVDFYGGVISDGYEKVKELCTDIYSAGSVLATDFNQMFQGWLGNFINDWLLPNYVTDIPIFSGGGVFDNIFSSPVTNFHSTASHDRFVQFMVSNSTLLGAFTSKYVIKLYSDYIYHLDLDDNNLISFTAYNQSGKQVSMFGSLSLYDNYLSKVNITLSTYGYFLDEFVINPLCEKVISFVVDGLSFYTYLGKFYQNPECTLELDPDVFNKDSLGDIDIAPPWADTYNDLTNSMDYTNHWVLGTDVTFDNTGDMVFPGTIDIPKDYTDDWVDDPTYPLVIPTDVPAETDIPEDIIIDKYPDVPLVPHVPTDYTADWTTVFPFCIPFDIFRFLEILSATPNTPKFDINMSFLGAGTIHVDLSSFDELANICRIGMDLIFIVGLAMITRSHLIKA